MKDNLWAPWRMQYVTNPNKGKNIFLEKSKSENDSLDLLFVTYNMLTQN